METLRRWMVRLGRLIASRNGIAAVLVACLLLGLGLTVLASLPETTPRDSRHFEGLVPPFAEGRNALAVPEAAYEGFGFGEARAEGLVCGVSVVFLDDTEWRAFQDTGILPPPQLHCDRTTADLPGSIAAVFVENERQDALPWAFDLALFGVARPYAFYGLPAIVLLLVAGIGLPIVLLHFVVPWWIDRQLTPRKKG